MGRAGTGASATSRALSPLRGTRSSPTLTNKKSYYGKHSSSNSSNYRSMEHLRALHAELVGMLDESSDTAMTGRIHVSSGAGSARAAKRDLRLIEVLRAIAELVRDSSSTRTRSRNINKSQPDSQSCQSMARNETDSSRGQLRTATATSSTADDATGDSITQQTAQQQTTVVVNSKSASFISCVDNVRPPVSMYKK